MAGLLVAGTTSDAGKSLLVTGLCRALARRGIGVAPFKAQNMSNNSMVCRDGAEIGRAQYLQAQAARVEATALMNPVLLKPGSDRTAHIVLRGRPGGQLGAGDYATGRAVLAQAAFESYAELSAQVEVVICEGAGSPTEVNLRAGDYVNLGLAQRFALPTIVVTDIDRGGSLAALYGTWALLDRADRALLRGYVVNKFRGDHDVLQPGLDVVTARTGLPWLGTLPYLHGVWLDSEDAIWTGRWSASGSGPVLRIAVVRFPRTSNATDVDALAAEPGVEVRVTDDPAVCRDADLLVLPGSRATVSDLAWLRDRGLAEVVLERAGAGRPILGICGGYQMLGRTIADDVESGAGEVAGLGVLDAATVFGADKVLGRPTSTWRGLRVEGYEIHHGVVTAAPTFPGGTQQGAAIGTLWHGILEGDDVRRALLVEVAEVTGSGWRPAVGAPSFASRREAMIDTLADAVEDHLAVDAIVALARGAGAANGSGAASAFVPPAVTASNPLDHHGDREVRGEGAALVDLAVNVRVPAPPAWLQQRLRAAIPELARYPDLAPARAALAHRHAVNHDQVLPTNGGAQAFRLIALGLPAHHPVIVHPQFSEPEAALIAAGRVPHHVVLQPSSGFTLDPALVDPRADLVVVGNPTNPTGVLHPRQVLESLRAPHRVLVVDEAFMDAVPGERESLLGGDLTGVLVIRSLTKTWGLAGLRAGYVVGDPDLIALLGRQQPPWSVSSLAAQVMIDTATPQAQQQADALARQAAADRSYLTARLRELGLDPVPGEAPFVLVQLGHGAREALRDKGFAVRRGDTFPGLDGSWVRIAVRDQAITDALIASLTTVLPSLPRGDRTTG